MSGLTKIKSERFGDIVCDFWKNENDEIFMTSEQLGRALGYADPRKSINTIVSRNPYLRNPEFSSDINMMSGAGIRNVRVFTEDGIYEVTFLSGTERAKQFRAWVRQVLKGLRSGQLSLIERFDIPRTYPEALRRLADEVEARQQLQEKVQMMEPKAEMYDVLLSSQNSQSMSEVAKCFGIGRNKLFAFLRDKKVLRHNNEPYQRYMDRGYFTVREVIIAKGDMTVNKTQTLVTAKGIDFIGRLLKEDGLIKGDTA